MLGIRELRLFDTDRDATAKLKLNLEAARLPGLASALCADTREAVRGADIVTTVTADKRNALILTPDMIEPGMHLNAVGGDCPGKTELHADILRSAHARIVVEFEPQARIEGEIQQLGPVDARRRARGRAVRQGSRPRRRARGDDLRLGGIRAERFLRRCAICSG